MGENSESTETEAVEGATAEELDTEAVVPNRRERRAAQAELAYLRTYSDVYRAHLRAYTEGVLRGIEEWERKEAASLQEAAAHQEVTQGPGERRSIRH